jgi:hypothetical protein
MAISIRMKAVQLRKWGSIPQQMQEIFPSSVTLRQTLGPSLMCSGYGFLFPRAQTVKVKVKVVLVLN